MIIAMVLVRVVQASIDQIVHMVAVRDGGMPAIGAVNVITGMPVSAVSAVSGMFLIHFNHVVSHPITLHMPQSTFEEIICVPAVFHRQVTAARAVSVSLLFIVRRHRNSFRRHSNTSLKVANGRDLQTTCTVFPRPRLNKCVPAPITTPIMDARKQPLRRFTRIQHDGREPAAAEVALRFRQLCGSARMPSIRA
jgi:hypothetical protein